jgi:hypothetical protein
LDAHRFGFVCGVIFGMVTEHLAGKYGRPVTAMNALLALASGGFVVAAWWCP